jgi:surfeit locus 1 family protein
MGARLIQPLDRQGAPPILIDRGWAPTDRIDPPPTTPVTVEGYLRTADRPGWFAATDDPAGRRFYTLDPAKIAAALGVVDAAPYVLVELRKPSGKNFPQPATALPRPPNDHFSYALTWFSLAIILVIIFVVFARKVFHP